MISKRIKMLIVYKNHTNPSICSLPAQLLFVKNDKNLMRTMKITAITASSKCSMMKRTKFKQNDSPHKETGM